MHPYSGPDKVNKTWYPVPQRIDLSVSSSQEKSIEPVSCRLLSIAKSIIVLMIIEWYDGDLYLQSELEDIELRVG